MTVAFVAACGSTAFAQTEAQPAKERAATEKKVATENQTAKEQHARAQDMKRACPMPDMRQVQSLDLEPEQLRKVREIHAECERDCAAMKEEKGSVDHAAMEKHQERVKEVLTPEQYEKYLALSSHKKMEKKEQQMKTAE